MLDVYTPAYEQLGLVGGYPTEVRKLSQNSSADIDYKDRLRMLL